MGWNGWPCGSTTKHLIHRFSILGRNEEALAVFDKTLILASRTTDTDAV